MCTMIIEKVIEVIESEVGLNYEHQIEVKF